MKKLFVAVATLVLCGSVFADNMMMPNMSAMNKNHGCKHIAKACKSAGFVKGGEKQGKGLWMNCMKPIIAGQTVTGVNVNPADVQACQAMHASR